MATAKEIRDALRVRYEPQAYALMFEVADGTGRYQSRWADAIAVSLWPSRGLTIQGFEIKVSRTDWLKELKQPAKAEAICKFCHQWWIVAGDKTIVLPQELPPTWGLLILTGRGFKAVVNAPRLSPEPVSPSFLAALMRSAAKPAVAADKEALQKSFQSGIEYAAKESAREIKLAKDALAENEDLIRKFEGASGIHFTYWDRKDPERIGKVVRDVLDGKHNRELSDVKRCRDIAAEVVRKIDESGVLKQQDQEG